MKGRIARIISVASLFALIASSCAQAEPTKPAATPTQVSKPAVVAPRPTAKAAAPRPAVIPTPQIKPVGNGDPGTIKIVTSFPHQGSSKGQADSIVNGIKMAIDDVGGKVGGFNLVLDVNDDSKAKKDEKGKEVFNWDGETEAAIANKAVSDPDVMAYIGTYNSGAAKQSIPITNRAGMIQISPANTYPGLTKPGAGEANEPQIYQPSGLPSYTRVTPSDDLQGAVGAIWAKELGAKTVYVLDDTELYGHGIAVIFAAEAKRLGIVVKNPGGISEGIDTKARDNKSFKPIALKIREANPDLVYYGGTTANQAPQLWKDLRETLDARVMLMGPDGIAEEDFIQSTGKASEGTYVTYPGIAPTKLTGEGAKWYSAYKAKYKAEPEVFAVMGYEAARAVIAGINKAGKKDRVAIMEAVFAIRDFDGPLGKWGFDTNGDTTLTSMTGAIVKNGKFEAVKELKVS